MTLFFIHLPQDLDLLSPVWKEFKKGEAAVWVTDRVYRDSPRTRSALASSGFPVKVVPYAGCFFGFWPSLKGYSSLVTAAESSARAHRVAHVLAQKADRLGIRTFTLQQGFENVGLNHSDERFRPGLVGFASRTIFLWGGLDTLDARVPPDVRRRCVPVGCPKEPLSKPFPARPAGWKNVIAVFENLHRHPASRARGFLDALKKTASAFPDTLFLLKPHHNQRWSARHARKELAGIRNVVLADPIEARWEPFTSTGLLAVADGVITLPSTVALDAARAGRPVAVAPGGLSLERYRPLTVLEDAGAWIAFLRRLLDGNGRREELDKAERFAGRTVVSGPAAKRIAEAARGKDVLK